MSDQRYQMTTKIFNACVCMCVFYLETKLLVGRLYTTFEEVEADVQEHKESQFVKFWKRDTRTIAAAKRRTDREFKPELKYYEIKYCCIHGGQQFKSQGKGIRNTW